MGLCSGCPYERYPKIPPSVPFRTAFAIVGEAPGASEIANRSPFVGQSGRLLTKALEAAGLPDRSAAFITNSMLCRPPAGKPIQKEPVFRCRNRLLQELKAVQPEVILALGNTALRSLMGDFKLKISDYQGGKVESPDLPGVAIVSAWHPAKILRTPGDYQGFQSAIRYAVDLLHGGNVKDPGVVTYDVMETYEDVMDSLSLLRNNLNGADIETGKRRRPDQRLDYGGILVLGVSYAKNKALIYPARVLKYTRPIFEDKNVILSWHNGQFDTERLRAVGLPARMDHDTMCLHYCLNENEGGHDLETLAVLDLGARPYKDDIKQYTRKGDVGFESVPEGVLYRRVAMDCDYGRQLTEVYLERISKDPGLTRLYYEILMPSSRFLRRLKKTGIYLNLEAVDELQRKLEAEREEKLRAIRELVGGGWDPEEYMYDTGAKTAPAEFNPASPKQLKWLLFEKYGLRVPKGVKKDSTDEEVLKKIESQHPVVPLILEFRSICKNRSVYCVGMRKRLGADGRIHSTFKNTRTVTGRLSSTDPNVQNIPGDPEIRSIFQAPPGRVLIEADYKAAELRVLAWISQDEFLKQVYQEGRDLHDEMATEIFGPDFTPRQRFLAKTVNFGIAYGRTAFSIARDFDLPLEEAEHMVQRWFERAPGALAYLQSCDRAARRGEVLATPFGRKRRFGLVTQMNVEDLQKEARNFRIQSIASDLTLLSAMRVEKQLKQYDAMIVNTVHDCILIEAPDDPLIINRIARLVASTMSQMPIEKLNSNIPFVAEVRVGKAWGKLEEYDLSRQEGD